MPTRYQQGSPESAFRILRRHHLPGPMIEAVDSQGHGTLCTSTLLTCTEDGWHVVSTADFGQSELTALLNLDP
jgi:hypothetical protein